MSERKKLPEGIYNTVTQIISYPNPVSYDDLSTCGGSSCRKAISKK
jgi:hypothetical protein